MKCLPSLNSLRAFDAVARLQSVSAAATALDVTPSAVSRQISNLEEEMGVPLLTRNGRGLQLTADGRRLEGGLGDAFMQISSAVDRVRQPLRGSRLRMLVAPMFASAWLVPRLDRFCQLKPGTDVVLIDQGERADAEINPDIAIKWGRFEDSATVIAEPLTHSEEVFPVCRQHLYPSRSLIGTTLIHCEPLGDPWSWPDWPAFAEAVGLDLTGTVNGPHLTAELLLDALHQGKGIVLVNTTTAHDDIVAGRVVRPIPESTKVNESYWMLISRTEQRRPEVTDFRDWLVKEVAACFGKRC